MERRPLAFEHRRLPNLRQRTGEREQCYRGQRSRRRNELDGGGKLTLDICGQAALWQTNDFTLIQAPSHSGAHGTVNRGIWSAPAWNSTNYHAALDNAYKMGSLDSSPASITVAATNTGWVTINSAAISGATFPLTLGLQTNGATHSIGQIVSQPRPV
jgi:hypothetical protein